MSTIIVLEPPAPFLSSNDRLHWRVKALRVKAWRDAARDEILNGFYPDFYERAHITVAIRFDNNIRRDVGNYYDTAKPLVDGCVEAGLLRDDSDAHVIGPDMRRHIPNGTPLVTVTITPLEETCNDRAV